MSEATCERCGVNPATNGRRCVNYAVERHVWVGDCHRSQCVVCFTVRVKRRKRTKGSGGSRWQTWYGLGGRDPDTENAPSGRAPRCA